MKSDYIPAPIDVSDIQLPSELSETEKDYDRRTAMETLKLIQKIGFGIKKVKN